MLEIISVTLYSPMVHQAELTVFILVGGLVFAGYSISIVVIDGNEIVFSYKIHIHTLSLK